jgi:hypothetical protein
MAQGTRGVRPRLEWREFVSGAQPDMRSSKAPVQPSLTAELAKELVNRVKGTSLFPALFPVCSTWKARPTRAVSILFPMFPLFLVAEDMATKKALHP